MGFRVGWFLECVSVGFGIEEGMFFIYVNGNFVILDFLSGMLWKNVIFMKFEVWIVR